MANFFGASLQVVALVIAIVCLISAILGRSYGIGPVQVPAPRELLPRAALSVLGLVLLTVAFWTPLFGGKSLPELLAKKSGFDQSNTAFKNVLETQNVDAGTVRLEAGIIYSKYQSAGNRCQVVSEIIDKFPSRVDVFPQNIISDAVKYQQRTADTRVLIICDAQMKKVAVLVNQVQRIVAAAAPNSDERVGQTAHTSAVTSRPTPDVNTNGPINQDTVRRVLSAVTLPADEGWIYIGFRNLDQPVLIADRRIDVSTIPRSGVVATIADSQLLNTDDPAKSLGTVKGYVRAGSAVQVLRISGPRHIVNTVWDGYDVYALVRVVSTPQTSPASTPAAAAVAAPAPSQSSPSPAAQVAAAAAKCAGLPSSTPTVFVYCNETYAVRFGDYQFQAYKVTDSHSTGIHFRSVGPHPVYLSIYPTCAIEVCPPVRDAVLAPGSNPRDAGNDYVYTAETLQPFDFGWTIALQRSS